MSDPDPEQRRRVLVHARCALGIVHAQYWRALMLAEDADGRERAAALAEARRLLIVAVGLRRRGDALEAAERAEDHPAGGHERGADSQPDHDAGLGRALVAARRQGRRLGALVAVIGSAVARRESLRL